MKTSYSHLPEYAKNDLKQIVTLIQENVPHCEMIILYGSYAKGTFVEYDERNEFGILTSFMSDYDLLVVTSNTDVREVGHLLDIVDDKYYKRPDNQVPIQFINDDIEKLNSDLSEGRYFYTGIQKQGIMLYDSGNCELEPARKLDFEEIRQQAQEYFEEKFKKSVLFMDGACHFINCEEFVMTSFMLHQACENFFYALRLVHTLKNSKQHNLSKLLGATHKYSPELQKIFPRHTKEEKRLFELLRLAYVEARYNSKFVVTKEDIETLFPKVERLRDITEQICKSQIEVYRQMGKTIKP